MKKDNTKDAIKDTTSDSQVNSCFPYRWPPASLTLNIYLTKTLEFVRSVTHLQGINHPVITLYTAQQSRDIKRFCCKEDGAVLGIDKTINIGEFHVTPTVYKDLSVLRRTTLDHPICFGPTFVHTNSSTKAYYTFMHDVADNLTDNELSQLTIGSDEELSFKTSIKRCFPGSSHIL